MSPRCRVRRKAVRSMLADWTKRPKSPLARNDNAGVPMASELAAAARRDSYRIAVPSLSLSDPAATASMAHGCGSRDNDGSSLSLPAPAEPHPWAIDAAQECTVAPNARNMAKRADRRPTLVDDAAPGRAAPGRAAPGRAAPGRAAPGRAAPGRAAPGPVGPLHGLGRLSRGLDGHSGD